MNITQVKIFPVNEDKLKAFVSVVFDHAFMVNDIKVIQGRDGLFLSMPSRRKKNGEFKDVAHPLNNKTRRMLEERVLREYRQVVDDPTPRRPDRTEAGGQTEAGRRTEPGGRTEGGRTEPGGRTEADGQTPVPAPAIAQPAAEAQDAVIATGDSVSPSEKTLEEVQDFHLRDSFWSVS